MKDEYNFPHTKGKVIHWQGMDYALAENIAYEIDEERLTLCGRDPEMYFMASAHAQATNDDEVSWSFTTLQEMFDWAESGDFQKNLDGVVHIDVEE